MEKLKTAGFAQEQAEAVVRVIADAQQEVVTREYLDHALEREFASPLGGIRTELAVLKWMMGVVIGCLVLLIIKPFFG